jgi:hypothetical protein
VVNDTEKGYYADGEDAYYMRCYSKNSKQETMDESAVESRTEQLHNLEVSANQCIEVCKTHDTLFVIMFIIPIVYNPGWKENDKMNVPRVAIDL